LTHSLHFKLQISCPTLLAVSARIKYFSKVADIDPIKCSTLV